MCGVIFVRDCFNSFLSFGDRCICLGVFLVLSCCRNGVFVYMCVIFVFGFLYGGLVFVG